MTAAYCSVCGGYFTASQTAGRPRKRCDACRTNHAKVDGRRWRELRAQVLREEPICCVPGCGRVSTQVDHVLPLKLRPDLALERTNLRGICASHNASKGARVNGSAETARDLAPLMAGTVRSAEVPCETCDYPRSHWCL